MGFLRRLFGGRGGEPPAEPSGKPLLDREELERIGTEDDLLRDYETASARNFRAMKAEESGEVEVAISLYERNVAEEFVEAHPYERLAVLYERHRRTGDALQVTERFIALAKSGRLPRGAQRSADRRLPDFEARAARYRASEPRQ
ncbi:Hypothetical Protein RradSPS_0883 [Rubrobacter radiotolerans]|uniref:Tetratricopeptide repeat protein n=1 Tax=Rubrobacter radiotolerans TaxID=42256 RepID=A0A023X1U0_RUBRA|nr:hypothetical protein [Rubrobacter radiotolerans]AHY46166.1 Hypothetical Protein RradSPS_0883 [Rubrobacter radiotolerans]MDX5893576.1 hypothetical protein [Rubrobacter radiotolerans]SMC04035.1 conserved hypothetical protein [Rubrobacter radiotolerans DSM 5868]